jgi:hypothetical protein
MSLRKYLTPDDIRHFTWDRAVEDNLVEFDLAFSDDEIKNAMEYMLMSFNDLPPIFITLALDINKIPRKAFLIQGVVYHLYLSKLAMESRNDITYNSGGVQVDFNKTLIGHLQGLIKLHKEEFTTGTLNYKKGINMSNAFDPMLGC